MLCRRLYEQPRPRLKPLVAFVTAIAENVETFETPPMTDYRKRWAFKLKPLPMKFSAFRWRSYLQDNISPAR